MSACLFAPTARIDFPTPLCSKRALFLAGEHFNFAAVNSTSEHFDTPTLRSTPQTCLPCGFPMLKVRAALALAPSRLPRQHDTDFRRWLTEITCCDRNWGCLLHWRRLLPDRRSAPFLRPLHVSSSTLLTESSCYLCSAQLKKNLPLTMIGLNLGSRWETYVHTPRWCPPTYPPHDTRET